MSIVTVKYGLLFHDIAVVRFPSEMRLRYVVRSQSLFIHIHYDHHIIAVRSVGIGKPDINVMDTGYGKRFFKNAAHWVSQSALICSFFKFYDNIMLHFFALLSDICQVIT